MIAGKGLKGGEKLAERGESCWGWVTRFLHKIKRARERLPKKNIKHTTQRRTRVRHQGYSLRIYWNEEFITDDVHQNRTCIRKG